MIQLPIEIGDVILTGRFKNKKVTVKEISYDNYGNPLINGRSILKIRMPKLYQQKESLTEVKQSIKYIGYKMDNSGKIFMYVESIDTEYDREFKGSVIRYGYIDQYDRNYKKKEKGWIRIDKPTIRYEKYGIVWEEGTINLDIKMDMNNKVEESIRKIVREVISELDVTERPDLEADARRYAELANKMKLLEAQLEEMSKEYEGLDDKFRKELEVIGETKDTFIRAGKILIKIERAAYDKKNKSYKTGWDYLYPRVNATMKQIADEAMALIETTSRVKSKIAVVNTENTINEGKVSDLINKMVNWVKGKLNRLSSLNKKANQEITQLEKTI